jgi:hypothetical protein
MSPFIYPPSFPYWTAPDQNPEIRRLLTPESLHEFVTTLKDYTTGPRSSDLKVAIKEDFLYVPEVKNILKNDRFVSYNPTNRTLTLKAMARPLHDSIQLVASRFIYKALQDKFLSLEEALNIQMSTKGQLLSGHCPDPEYVPGLQVQRKKRRAWFKYPDAAYVFTDQKTFKSTPTIIFEVGFSEPYQDLLAGVNDWIVYTDTVQLVVILDIVEDVKLRNLYQKSNVSSSRVEKLLKAFCNSQAKAAHEMDDRDDDPDSDSEMYTLIGPQFGPMRANLSTIG